MTLSQKTNDMKSKIIVFFILSAALLTVSEIHAQNGDEQQIRTVRALSNEALKNFDEASNYQYLTEDVLITTGNGSLISGKKALMEYIGSAGGGPRMYWVRTPDEVEVNSDRGLAWESGTWKGFEEGAEESVIGGRYSAQWVKASGKWLIRSQLFVTLIEK